jgi:hypothetical protein
MSIYNVNMNNFGESLLPPLLREPKEVAWVDSLFAPLQYNNDNFNRYIDGYTDAYYVSGTSYNVGDRVIYLDNYVYECIASGVTTPPDITSWYQVNENYIGARERTKINAQKINYEYYLNRAFRNLPSNSLPTTWTGANHTTQIYIENTPNINTTFLIGNTGPFSSNLVQTDILADAFLSDTYLASTLTDYTIWVPNFIYSGTSENTVRKFANMVNLAGMRYAVSGF